ncbi:hypothetical protein FAZ95_13605 [Trinickia violacea]|uniref:Uncharacterized protein n=1 Tax=Trinickia violacea TaxID=2571746 RepID=A0A4P8IMD8_9BURK|nr:hypothetical protein [Trinickia violacea]QCP50118.1 hypothetical protein FAZ95_13605 [Trinickia violacea]
MAQRLCLRAADTPSFQDFFSIFLRQCVSGAARYRRALMRTSGRSGGCEATPDAKKVETGGKKAPVPALEIRRSSAALVAAAERVLWARAPLARELVEENHSAGGEHAEQSEAHCHGDIHASSFESGWRGK